MEEGLALNIHEFYHITKKRAKMILVITLICGLISGVLSYYVIKPTYQAQATIIVGKPQSIDKSQQYSDIIMYQNLVKTYSEIAKSRSVAEAAKSKLNFSITATDIQNSITVTAKEGTQILMIKAETQNAQEVVAIVNAVTTSLIEESKTVFPTGGDIQVMDNPQFPSAPVKPRKLLNIAIAILIGLMGSVGLAYMFEYLDRTIKDEEDVDKYLGLPVIGLIPKEL